MLEDCQLFLGPGAQLVGLRESPPLKNHPFGSKLKKVQSQQQSLQLRQNKHKQQGEERIGKDSRRFILPMLSHSCFTVRMSEAACWKPLLVSMDFLSCLRRRAVHALKGTAPLTEVREDFPAEVEHWLPYKMASCDGEQSQCLHILPSLHPPDISALPHLPEHSSVFVILKLTWMTLVLLLPMVPHMTQSYGPALSKTPGQTINEGV